MAELDQYYTALKNADAAGDVEAARKIAAHIKTMQSAPPAKPETTMLQDIKQGAGNLLAGGVRGAGSIGTSILSATKLANEFTPFSVARSLINGENPLEKAKQIGAEDTKRRADLTSGLEYIGAQPDSMLFKTGKLAGEIAGTAGTGGVIANTTRAVAPAIAASRYGAPVLDAIATSGMKAGGMTGIKSVLPRMIGGGVTGGASAALIDPETAGTGAAFGAALPPAMMVLGKGGKALGNMLSAPKQTDDMVNAINAARSEGYVIPPTQANPNLKNRLLEGMAGKLTTAQNASAKNQVVTNQLAAKSLGLPAETKLTPEVLQQVRKLGGDAYEAVANTGTITPSQSYMKALDDIAEPFNKAMQGFPNAKPSPVLQLVESLKSPQFDAASAVSKIKELRTAADDAFRTGNTDIARASKRAAGELENVLESHLQSIGQPELLKAFKDGRQLIAKTYTVEKALNQVSGSVDARKLASQLQKGKPLSGDLKSVAEFASRFPKASQAVEGMGSLPQTSPLDWMAGASLSAASANPLGLLAVGARPIARSATLSPFIQNRLIQQQGGLLQNLEPLQQLGYQSLPAIFSR
jgi:hypothetical protein